MKFKVDFHTHSTASDGRKSPSDLVKAANLNSVKIMALTDHDTLKGLDEAISEGLRLGIRVIPGIELSALHNGESVHILGYFKGDGYHDHSLINFLKDKEDSRLKRAEKFIENLDTFFDIKINYNDVLKISNGLVARPHIAKAIIDAGYDYSWNYIFEKFLSDSSPAYVSNKKVSIPEAITLLHNHNALAVLAHPILLKKNSPTDLIRDFDFDGIEGFYHLNSRQKEAEFITLAHNYNKLITCGSDYHGIDGDGKHGMVGDVRFSDDYLNKFLKTLKIGC